MKILFVAQNLQMGGIQRALINQIKELINENKYSIEVFSFGEGLLIQEMPPQITVHIGSLPLRLISAPFSSVKAGGNILHLFIRIVCMIFVRLVGSKKFYRYLFKVQKKFHKYDVAISYFNDAQGNYFNRGTNQFVDECIEAEEKIAWIHTDPIMGGFEYGTALQTYKNFDRIVCVSYACRQKFIELLPQFKNKTCVVYNFFPIDEIKAKAIGCNSSDYEGTSIVSVGRIDNVTKRFDLIPLLCKMLKVDSITNFHWRIVGDGPDLELNKKLAEVLEVTDLVKFVGEKPNPYSFIKESDMLVLTSAFEGYPMVVGEALVLGVPVVTTCYAAAGEQIRNNHNGIITKTKLDDMYSTLKYLIQNPEKITKLKNNIHNDNFSNMDAMQQFIKIVG